MRPATPIAHGLVVRPWQRGRAADLGALALLLGAALATGSLCLVAQLVRHGGIALAHAIAAGGARLARGRMRRQYQFGLEKLGRCCELLLGLALVAAAAWLIRIGPAVTLDLAGRAPAVAACAAVAHLAWLLWSWPEERRRSASRWVGFAAQLALTLAAVSQDPAFVRFGDLAAGVLVASLSLRHGLRIAIDAVRDLVDRPIDPETLLPVLETLEGAGIPLETIARLRSRQVGPRLFIELELRPRPDDTLEALTRRLASAGQAVRAGGHSVDLAFRLA